MNITINGLQMGLGTSYHLESPVEGLETPPIRTSSHNYSGRDGGQVTGQFYSPRLITLNGFIIGGTDQSHEDARQALQNALPIRLDLPVTIETFSDVEYLTTVRIIDLKMPVTDPVGSRFKIDLLASDPNFYTSVLSISEIPIDIGGGFTLPVVFPIIFSEGTSPTVINNNGSVIVYPVFTITGESTNPIITKLDTGEKVEMDLVMGISDELEVDMLNRTITLNGSSAVSFRSSDSDWFGLDVGANRFTYASDDAADTGIAQISWRTAVLSI